MGRQQVYLHIGVMKTGTTALQNSVFSRCEGLSYFGKPLPALAPAIRDITTLGPEQWAQRLPDISRSIAAHLAVAGDRVLISEEEFSSGGEIDSAADRRVVAQRLHHLFPEASILIVVRNQFDALRSLFAYVMAMSDRYVEFPEWLLKQEEVTGTDRGLEIFDYASLVELYRSLFPTKNVHVLCHEDLRKNYKDFATNLAEAMKLNPSHLRDIAIQRHNVRPSLRRVKVMQSVRRNPWLIPMLERLPPPARRSIDAWVDRGPDVPTAYDAASRRRVEARYGASNARLAASLGIDLESRGYPCTALPSVPTPTPSPAPRWREDT